MEIIWSSKFKKDYKKMIKQGKNIELLDNIIIKLANNEKLSEKCNDHDLHGNWEGYRECHISPDWLLVYKYNNNRLALLLTRTGSHTNILNI